MKEANGKKRRAHKECYEKAGLPREQLVLTGALYDDIITAALQRAPATRAALLAELGMDQAKTLIL